MSKTTIYSNGSNGENLEPLFERFTRSLLEPRFEAYGCLREAIDGRTCFFGNFADYSYVFRVETDDPGLIARFDAAIATQQSRPEYQEWLQECRQEIADRESRRRQAIPSDL